jgi:hypothetical protein
MSDIVQKLWGFCHTLRHDGVDYGDYIEQLTYLLFLKMAEEKGVEIPKGCDWDTLKKLSGTDLTDHYNEVLRKLRSADGLLGDIFTQATSRFTKGIWSNAGNKAVTMPLNSGASCVSKDSPANPASYATGSENIAVREDAGPDNNPPPPRPRGHPLDKSHGYC